MNEKKQEAQNTEHSLREAEKHVRQAEQHSQNTGDKQLIEKVTKIRKDVQTTREDLSKKLDNHQS